MEPGPPVDKTTPNSRQRAVTASAPPNWDLVHFDVACARCGHDLHGLTEPCCPQCSLEFDWSDAVPLEHLTCKTCGYHLYGLTETRCPECGEEFTWTGALREYHRSRQPFFEARWRDAPIRSYLKTCWWSLRPGRFWRRMDLHDTPRVEPLIGLVGLSMVALYLSNLVMHFSYQSLEVVGRNLWGPGWMDHITGYASQFWRSIRWAYAPDVAITILAWSAASLAALLVFRQSMRRCKLRTEHVLRVWAHSWFLVLPLAVVAEDAQRFVGLFTLCYDYYYLSRIAVALAVLAFVTWSAVCGYRHYLKMTHAAAVVVSAQVVGVLTTVAGALLLRQLGMWPGLVFDVLYGARLLEQRW